MNTKLKMILVSLALCGMTACNTQTRVRNQPIVQQLNKYLGQTPNTITQHLNLHSLGIHFIAKPILNENQLIYTFERSIATPIPTGISARDEKSRMIQTQIATTSDSMHYALRCNIIFQIENGVATSYQLKGRAC